MPASLGAVFNDSLDTVARMKAVDGLHRELSPQEMAALRWLLKKPDENEALRNSAARKLLECEEQHLAADLTEMLWDGQETPKWRNYCVQFLKGCYDRDSDSAILTTLFRASEADETKVRICAVWGLACVATPRDRRKTPDKGTLKTIRTAALSALREKDAHFLITTTGVQSCARLGLKDALPDVRKLAADRSTKPTHLRVVSIAALGDLGNDSDLPLLERVASSSKGQLKSAAALSAKKIRRRAAGAEIGTEPARKAPAGPAKGTKAEPSF